ncbi:MAG: hypothetical protein J6U54_07065 [Clostridiales bacterium]|nr:hypothetical protein [Clostridiales bacterium]
MSELNATPVTFKCKICGGDIVNNFLVGSCVCAHCGNKWNLEEMIPDYSQYSNIISNINEANAIVSNNPTSVSLERAKTLLTFAIEESGDIDGVVALELANISRDEIGKIDQLQSYLKGMSYFNKQNYQAALTEFEKIPGYKNTEELKEQCKIYVTKDRKAQRVLEVAIGMLAPAMVCIVLKILADVSFAILIPVFLVASAVLGFFIYRGGLAASIIEFVSFMLVGPFVLFLIIKYDIHIMFFKICKVVCIYLFRMIKYCIENSNKE